MIHSLTKTLASIGQGVSKSLESGVNSVRTKLNDPNLQKEVKEKAAAGWSRAQQQPCGQLLRRLLRQSLQNWLMMVLRNRTLLDPVSLLCE